MRRWLFITIAFSASLTKAFVLYLRKPQFRVESTLSARRRTVAKFNTVASKIRTESSAAAPLNEEELEVTAKQSKEALTMRMKELDMRRKGQLEDEVEVSRSSSAMGDLASQLESDISLFRARESETNIRQRSTEEEQGQNAIIDTLKDVLAKVLVADLALVLVFLVWFLVAAVMQQSGNPFLLEKFQDIFAPVVQPSLGLLMLGSVLSGVAGDRKEKDN